MRMRFPNLEHETMIPSINLDNELSTEFDNEPHPKRIARLIKKYEHITMFTLSQILKKHFHPDDIQSALKIYFNGEV